MLAQGFIYCLLTGTYLMIDSKPILKPTLIPIDSAIKAERLRLSDNLDAPQTSILLTHLQEQKANGATHYAVVPF